MPNLDTSIAPAVNYHMVGKGPALVLLHGFPESSAIWQPIGAFLSQWYTVIMPDMPGVGATPYLQPASIADMAIIVKEILDELDIPKAVIYGHSMGGYIALAFAQQFPECVAGLSLIHSTPEADNEEKIINRRRVMEIIRNGGKNAFIEQMIPNLFAASYVARCPEIIQNQIQKGKVPSAEALINFYEAMIARPLLASVLTTDLYPVQMVLGDSDNLLNTNTLLQYSYLANVNFVMVYTDCGHMSMIEMPELLQKDMATFAQYCLSMNE